jgi:hypothetical protein
MDDRTRFKLDLAVVRALLDEVERGIDRDDGVSCQLVDELERLTASLARARTPRSEKRLRGAA